MHDGDRSPTLIQSVQRALRLVEAVSAANGRAQAKELARSVGLSLSTTYHLLRTLTHEGYLSRLDDGSYVLGPSFAQVTSQNRMAAVLARARPAMQGLRDELRNPIYLALYHEGEIAVVEVVDSPKVPSIDLWVGIHDSAHATALGKCILGALDDERRADYLARHPLHPLPAGRSPIAALIDEIHSSPAVARDDEEYGSGCTAWRPPWSRLTSSGPSPSHAGEGRPSPAVEARLTTTLVSGAERIGRAFGLPASA